MRGVFLSGNSTTEVRDLPDPEAGPGEVVPTIPSRLARSSPSGQARYG